MKERTASKTIESPYVIESFSGSINVQATFTVDEAAVTFTQPTGGTLTVTDDGTAIASGDKVMSGSKIVVTAEADEGYRLVSIDYTIGEDTEADGEVTFTMPAPSEAITISAVFDPIPTYALTIKESHENGGVYAVTDADEKEIEDLTKIYEGTEVTVTVTAN